MNIKIKIKPWNYVVWWILIWALGTATFFNAATNPSFYHHKPLLTFVTGSQFKWIAILIGYSVSVLSVLLSIKNLKIRQGFLLFKGSMFLYLGGVFSIKFGTVPHFNPVVLLMVFIFLSLYFMESVDIYWFLRQVKSVLLLYVYGSLFMAVVYPDWAFEQNYSQGYIPGFDIRLHAFGVHANNLAALLVVYLILDYLKEETTKLSLIHKTFCLIALVLTQSKTAYAILLIILFVKMYHVYLRSSRKNKILSNALIAISASVISTFIYLSPFVQSANDFVNNNKELTTFTGRTFIWEYTVDAWRTNEMFGFGHYLWGDSMMNQYASVYNFAPRHAHSQLFQTLGESGYIGILGLIIYILILLHTSIKYFKVTKGVSLCLVVFILIRGFFEPIFRYDIQDSNLFSHFVIFGLLLLTTRHAEKLKQIS